MRALEGIVFLGFTVTSFWRGEPPPEASIFSNIDLQGD